MDQIQLQQKIALYYSKLPPNVRTLFSGMNWIETLKTISKKYSLNEEQMETLGTETTLVLLGIIHLVEYEEALTNGLGLSRDSTDKMLIEIEESIIKTIRPQLVEAFEANENSIMEADPNIEPKLDERFEILPKITQNIVLDSNYRATLYSIAKGYNLNVEQTGLLEKVVTNLVIGVIKPDELEDIFTKNLRLPLETVKKIVNIINEEIFQKIRKELLVKTAKKEISEKNSPLPEYPLGEGEMNLSTSSSLKASQSLNGPSRERATPEEGNKLPVEEKLELTGEVRPVISPESSQGTSNSNNEVHPILAQKFFGSLQIPTVKTDHTLENITKNINTNSSDTAKSPKIDPYREIPE